MLSLSCHYFGTLCTYRVKSTSAVSVAICTYSGYIHNDILFVCLEVCFLKPHYKHFECVLLFVSEPTCSTMPMMCWRDCRLFLWFPLWVSKQTCHSLYRKKGVNSYPWKNLRVWTYLYNHCLIALSCFKGTRLYNMMFHHLLFLDTTIIFIIRIMVTNSYFLVMIR